MNIENLTCKPNNHFVTVTMNYEEVRDIANGLYWLSRLSSKNTNDMDVKPEHYTDVTNKMAFLFDMIKHGMIQSNTIAKMSAATQQPNELDMTQYTKLSQSFPQIDRNIEPDVRIVTNLRKTDDKYEIKTYTNPNFYIVTVPKDYQPEDTDRYFSTPDKTMHYYICHAVLDEYKNMKTNKIEYQYHFDLCNGGKSMPIDELDAERCFWAPLPLLSQDDK